MHVHEVHVSVGRESSAQRVILMGWASNLVWCNGMFGILGGSAVFHIHRGLALRVFFALLIGLMSANLSTAMAEEGTDAATPAAVEPIPVSDEGPPAEDEGTETEGTEVNTTPGATGPAENVAPTEEPEDPANISSSSVQSNERTVGTLNTDPQLSTVSLYLTSADPSLANQLPADATWTVSIGDDSISDTFAAEHLQLPATIGVSNQMPYGHYSVTVNAGPVFEAYTTTFRIDEPNETFGITLEPVKTSAVTIVVDTADDSIAAELPADTTWTVTKDGVAIGSDTFAADDLDLPATIQVNAPMPYGDYVVTVDASPAFAVFTNTFTVDGATKAFNIELQPIPTHSSVTIELSSANVDIANAMPAGSTWSVSQGGIVLATDVFAADDLQLPAAIAVTNPVPFGDYTISIDASSTFADYEGTVTIDQAEESVEIELVPMTLVDQIVETLIAILIEILADLPAGGTN